MQFTGKKDGISIHALREEGDHILPVFPQQAA